MKILTVIALSLFLSYSTIANDPPLHVEITQVEKEVSAKKAELKTAEGEFQKTKATHQKAQLEYLKVKSASRDWTRRNNAEESYLKTLGAFSRAKLSYHLAGASVDHAKSTLTLLKKHQINASRHIAQAGKSPAPFGFIKKLEKPYALFGYLTFLLLLGFFFSDLVKSVVAWGLIKVRSLYRLDDVVEIAGKEGRVVGIGLFKTTLLEERHSSNPYLEQHNEKNIIIIPNHIILNNPVEKKIT